jgi:AcrR family transcriptional regulator
MSSNIPLRARKKAKVREALVSASFRLFSQKGYTETTLEEICEQCDVTVQTLLRYFGSKDDLLFAKHQTILEKVGNGLAQAARTMSSVDYWVKFLHSNALLVRDNKEIGQTYKIIIGAPSLLARFYAIARQYQALLEQALSEEVGLKAGEDLHATLFAQLIVMGPIEEALRTIARGDVRSMVERVDRVAQFVVDNYTRPAGKAVERAPPRKKSEGAAPSKRKHR